MSSIPISTERPEAPLFCDGLGDRVVAADGATGELLQILRIRPELTAIPSFEFALRERTARLANFRHAYYARVRRVDRVQAPAPGLAIVSDHVEGTRLSEMLRIAHERRLQLDINAALCLIRQLVPAVALLHENARDVAHGLIAPERLIVTPHARLVIVEHVLAAAIEQLQFSRDRLWQEFRVAMPPTAGLSRFDHRADVTGVGLVALALLLGRPLEAGEYPHRVPMLLREARERTALGEEQPLSAPLNDWLTRALQVDTRRAFASAPEALTVLEDLIAGDSSYVPAPVALETFLSRYIAALLDPTPAEAPSATTIEFPARAQAPRAAEPPAPAPAPVAVPAAAAPAAAPAPQQRPAAAAPPAPQQRPAAAAPPEPPRPAAAPTEPSRQPAGAPAPVANVPEIADLIPVDDLAVPKGTGSGRPSLFGPDGPFGNADAEPEEPPEPAEDRKRGGRWKQAALALTALAILAAAGIVAPKFLGPSTLAAPEMGTLAVQSNPPGVQIVIDGVERGMTPATISVEPGAHILELRGRGVPRVIPLNVTAGAQVSHYIEFANTPETGGLRVDGPAGAKVVVDGVERGAAPLTVADLLPGDHEVVLQTADGSTRHVVSVQAGGTALVVPSGAPAAPAAEGPVSGWIRVRAPFTIEIHEGGRVVGTTDADRIMLAAGRHELEFVNEALGYRATRAVTVQAGRVSTITAELPSGTVNLNALPWAEVFIDGQRVGETPIGNLAVPIGPHEIIFRHPQFGEKRHAISVTLTAPVRLSVEMR